MTCNPSLFCAAKLYGSSATRVYVVWGVNVERGARCRHHTGLLRRGKTRA